MVFTRDFELARRAAPADGKQHTACRVTAAISDHGKSVVLMLDLFHALAEIDLDVCLGDHLLPDFHQHLFGGFPDVHFAEDGKLHGRGHYDLAARIMQCRTAKSLFLFDGHVTQAMTFGCKRRGYPGGTCTDDDHIMGCFAVAPLLDRFHRLAPLFGCLSDQTHTTEFTGNENTGNIGFEIWFELG